MECDRGATSYQRLWADAHHTAHRLRAHGPSACREVVVVAAERGAPFITAALACWLTGAAYLPLGSAGPVERHRQIVRDAGAQSAVTSEEYEALCRELGLAVVPVRSSGAAPPHFAPVADGWSHGAYVIYTSGSTGVPKGVQVGHDSLANLMTWHLRAYQVGAEDRALHTASLGFDAAVWEIWPYLAAGATVVTASEDERLVPEFIVERLREKRCTMAFVATPLAEELLRSRHDLPDMRYLLTGGDVLRLTGPLPRGYRLVNHYGPTEATVVTTAHVLETGGMGDRPPIGAPMDGAKVTLLDAERRPVDEGAEGEIYIGGRCLAMGYLRDPELTRRTFVSLPDRPGRWYRTRDLAVRHGDTLTFTRRLDLAQLKIRGVRMGAVEIEAALLACDGIRAVAVTVLGVGAESVVVAVAVPVEGAPDLERLRGEMLTRLPAPVVPNRFVFVDHLPLNQAGKVDRQAVMRIATGTPEDTDLRQVRR